MSEDLKPYKVEVDDHSDDCGTVYRLTGPNMSLTSKHEQDLQDLADDLNLGFEGGRVPLPRLEPKSTETQELCPKCKSEVEWVVLLIPGVKPFFQCQDPDCNWISDDDFPVTESKMKGVD